jgi:phosphoribosylaminoimidazolecarboxamide formyltransferase/IMP cyclohydrolase
MSRPRRALISVADKRGVADFARILAGHGYEVVSSGGTAKLLEQEGVAVRRVSDVTGSPEILGGRVKTLHPRIHGGILARRNRASDLEELESLQIAPVDVVVVNFYPFEETVAKGSPLAEVIENIDIGGPTLLRAAAKNFEHVLAVTDPADYDLVSRMLEEGIDPSTRLYLARKAFQASARYEASIAAYLEGLEPAPISGAAPVFPRRLNLGFEKVQDLRYGENPHQRAAFYRDLGRGESMGMAGATQLQGKELSYNNILDLDAAWRLVRELPASRAAAAVIKHTNPCGVSLADSLREAYIRARAADPVSAFGGIVALNRPVDRAAAEELSSTFLEAVAAPDYEPEALELLAQKKNLRVMKVEETKSPSWSGFNLYRVLGGLLVQDWDKDPPSHGFGGSAAAGRAEAEEEAALEWKVATAREPGKLEQMALRFAWIVAKHVKSNAIVLAREETVLGVGAGQMSRVDSCRIAIQKAGGLAGDSVAASDAFFPFRDGIDVLAEAGVRAVIQPGGSVRDEEVIAACNERGLAMVFTGRRHFRH